MTRAAGGGWVVSLEGVETDSDGDSKETMTMAKTVAAAETRSHHEPCRIVSYGGVAEMYSANVCIALLHSFLRTGALMDSCRTCGRACDTVDRQFSMSTVGGAFVLLVSRHSLNGCPLCLFYRDV